MRAVSAIAGSLTSAVALLVGAVAVSPAAQAAEHAVDVVCDEALGDITVYGDVGDTFVFTLASTCTDRRRAEGEVDWELNNSLIYNYDESRAKPGLFAFVGAVNEGDSYAGEPSWWVASDGSGTTVVTATLMSASLGNGTYPDPVSLTIGGKVAQVDNNVSGDGGGPGAGFKVRSIIYGGPGDGPSGGGSTAPVAPVVTFTLSSSAADRGTCWPAVSGRGGSWVQLTADGCTAPRGHDGTVLLGWATNPSFPAARALNGVAVDEEFGGVRMIFIPVDGFTFLSGDNTLYPIWHN